MDSSDTNRLVLAYVANRLRHPEHPGLTRREYVLHRQWARRRLIWQLAAMLSVGVLLAVSLF
ncbi:hypothetical protein [Nitrospira calida]|jgi:DNA-binding CsgD family transcriptional regulator